MEELEPRLLFSADLPGVLAQSGLLGGEQDSTPTAIIALVDAPAIGIAVGDDRETSREAVFALTQPKTSTTPQKELVFIDAGAPNYQQLINDLLKAQAEGRPIEVVVLESGRDGVEQITEAMAERRDVSAVHIVSHGSDGSLSLGDTKLNAYNMERYRDAIAGWQGSLAEGADLLIYGCDFAGSAQGRDMVDTNSALNGADVAASKDKTGVADRGGDWELEYEAGEIETGLAFSSELQEDWRGTLADYIVTDAGNAGAGTLRDAITQANASVGVHDNIYFDLGAGVQTITISTTMVSISDSLTIDGTRNSAAVIDPDYTASGNPVVEIDGNGVAGNALTLAAGSDGSTIRGLAIGDFAAHGIAIQNSSNNVIAGNFLGTDASGSVANSNQVGISVSGNSTNNTIGGTTPADRNIISANTVDGMQLFGAGVQSNVIAGNYIGLDVTGTIDMGNTNQGISISRSSSTPATTP
jgi:hypothetical protein